jgi:hypothetical protein
LIESLKKQKQQIETEKIKGLQANNNFNNTNNNNNVNNGVSFFKGEGPLGGLVDLRDKKGFNNVENLTPSRKDAGHREKSESRKGKNQQFSIQGSDSSDSIVKRD